MADKDADQSEQSSEYDELVKHVDEMMAPEDNTPKPDVKLSSVQNLNPKPPEGPYRPKKVKPAGAPPIDGIKSKVSSISEPPLVIKLADEDTDGSKVEDDEIPADDEAEPFSDQKTDQAVDDIESGESDTLLALDDARIERKNNAVVEPKSSLKTKLKKFFKNKWTWVGTVVLLVILFGVPFTRYKILGLIIKEQVTVTVLDSKTGTPVSKATVILGGGAGGMTNADGKAIVKAGLGKRDLQISKQYYQTFSSTYQVGFKSGQAVSEKIVATGRLIPITLTNTITGKPVAGAEIDIKNTVAKSNSAGQAYVAVPASATTASATISASGFNSTSVTVQVTDQAVAANIFNLTPSGSVYYLSSTGGIINVVKSNLDGTGRKTILDGTGQESPSTTKLMASTDGRYLVLEASRDAGAPELYLIDTSNNQLTPFDTSGASFNLIGWYNHAFIYDLTKTSQPFWQDGRETLKSYDADNQQLNQLDQNQAEGSSGSYAYQDFSNFNIAGNQIIYSTVWNATAGYNTDSKNDTIRGVQFDGQNKKDYQTFDLASTGAITAQLYQPGAIYFSVYNNDKDTTQYYQYQNQAVQAASITSGTFNANYPTYLLSPNGNQTFWTAQVSGINSLFTGDASGANKKQVSGLDGYTAYGWSGNSYLLASKNGQLYVLPAAGLIAGHQPVKIGSYYQPIQGYFTYSGLSQS